MLCGKYVQNMDSKNRILMPVKLREELGEPFVLARDIREKCIKVYSLAGWQSYIAPLEKLERKTAEKIMRSLYSTMAQIRPDNQGRITLPQELVDFAGITGGSAMVVGCGTYAEIWSESVYNAMAAEEDRSEILRVLEEQGL